MHYAVLGLGDTNYDKFCFVGKFIDKRLEELGGKRFLPVHCADEAINMEDVVSSFTKQVTKLLADIVLRASSAVEAPPVTLQDTSSSPLTPAIVAVTPAQNDLSKTLSNVEALPVFASPVIIPVAEEVAATPVSDDRNKADPAAAATPLLPSPSPPSALPDGVQDLPTLAKVLNLIVELSLAPLANQLPPLRHSGKAICQLLPPATPSPVNGDDVASKEWSAVHPYHATVKTARWLANSSSESNATSDDEDARQVLFLELDLGQSGITYSPGDSIGVCCPNPETLVELTLQRLSLAEDSDLSLDSMVLSGAEEGQVISLGELLRFRYLI